MFFERLQAGLAGHGFPRSERFVPIGLPLPAYQVFYRWKREEPFSTVVSAGPGLLAVSARHPTKDGAALRPSSGGSQTFCSTPYPMHSASAA